VAIPLKLPAPVLGTDEQAAPKSAVDGPEPDGIAEADEPAMDEAADDGEEDEPDEVVELPELQAAAPRARPAAATEAAAMR
jgi:hypothetical protein